MKKIWVISGLLVLSFCLYACQPVTQTALPTSTAMVPTYIIVTATSAPTVELPTVTAQPTELPTTTATAAPATGGQTATLPDISSNSYVDDRSTPAGLMLSYVNAINRHEYIRAYSYWISPASTLGSLDAYSNTYTNVASEALVMGNISEDGAAGSIYYTLPVVFTDTLTDSTVIKYTGCYVLRLPQPGNYGEPPIQPMNIDRGNKTGISSTTSDSDALSSACNPSDYPAGNTAAPAVQSISDLGASNYIDNRSGAVEVVSSLLNAINRKEYVRAYSYWENAASSVGNFDNYAAGYKDTGSVTAKFGSVSSDAGAGNFYYKIPLAMFVTTTSNTQQTFVGCYTLHLSNPGMQGTLPFQPLATKSGKFTKVANGTDVAPLLATACN